MVQKEKEIKANTKFLRQEVHLHREVLSPVFADVTVLLPLWVPAVLLLPEDVPPKVLLPPEVLLFPEGASVWIPEPP